MTGDLMSERNLFPIYNFDPDLKAEVVLSAREDGRSVSKQIQALLREALRERRRVQSAAE